MKSNRIIFATVFFLFGFIACSKEQTSTPNPEPEVSATEMEALKKEVAELRCAIEDFIPDEEKPKIGISVEEFEALKQENEELKAQVATLMSTFFEVDGLRFDKNGDVISTPKIENTYEKQTNTGKLSMTRTFDDKGRLTETYGKYSGYSSAVNPPYYWQRVNYEYKGKTVTKNTETSSYSYGIYTNKETSEVTYW